MTEKSEGKATRNTERQTKREREKRERKSAKNPVLGGGILERRKM